MFIDVHELGLTSPKPGEAMTVAWRGSGISGGSGHAAVLWVTIVSQALVGSLGPCGPGPCGTGPCGPPGPSWARAIMGLKYTRGGDLHQINYQHPYLQVCSMTHCVTDVYGCPRARTDFAEA